MLLCCGLNHKTASVDVREKVYFSSEQLQNSLKDFKEQLECEELVILSTCNRTEIYTQNLVDNPHKIIKITDWLSNYHQIKTEQLKKHLYTHHRNDAIKHVIRVASGLDSQILGEPQIFGQLKTAVDVANKSGTLGSVLRRFFEHAFLSVKKIRSETDIGCHTISLAPAIIRLAKTIFENVSQCKVLFIGAGEMIELIAKYFSSQHLECFYIANRTLSRAEKIAYLLDGNKGNVIVKSISLQEIPTILSHVDIVVSGIHHITPIIGKGVVETVLKARKHKPILMIDLAVPRNIESEIKNLEDVYLYHIDDLEKLLNENYHKRLYACNEAEKIIELQAHKYCSDLELLKLTRKVRDYRNKMHHIRDEVLQQSLRELSFGNPPHDVIKKMAYQLTNKLIHHHCIRLKEKVKKI